MTAETIRKTYETDSQDCEGCTFEVNLCLRAAMSAVRRRESEVHNEGVRALIGMASPGEGPLGEIACAAPGCEKRSHVEAHYFIIDAL